VVDEALRWGRPRKSFFIRSIQSLDRIFSLRGARVRYSVNVIPTRVSTPEED